MLIELLVLLAAKLCPATIPNGELPRACNAAYSCNCTYTCNDGYEQNYEVPNIACKIKPNTLPWDYYESNLDPEREFTVEWSVDPHSLCTSKWHCRNNQCIKHTFMPMQLVV